MPVSDLVDDRIRQSVSRNLILKGVITRHSVYRHDNVKAAQGGQDRGEEDAIVRRGANRDEGRDPLVLQDLLKASILVAEQELVDIRRHNGLRLWAQAPERNRR